MTNKEKEQYLNDLMILMSNPFLDEFYNLQRLLKNTPKILYKYYRFRNYSYEMLNNPYVYLAPVEGLDDPFDCMTNMGLDDAVYVKNEDVSIAVAMSSFIAKTTKELGGINLDYKRIEEIILKCFHHGEYDEERAQIAVNEFDNLNIKQKTLLLDCFRNIDPMVKSIVSDKSIEALTKVANNPGKKVGVCAFSTRRDNKVMWSLYGKVYEGYCVEYEIPNNKRILFNLCPVIYKRNDDNNFIHKLVKFALSNCVRFSTDGKISKGIGCFNELFCVKDTDWSFQDEWRLIGDSGQHIDLLKIKAVYLGFKVSKYRQNKIKKFAYKNGYDVYLMNKPNGKKKINYTKITKSFK